MSTEETAQARNTGETVQARDESTVPGGQCMPVTQVNDGNSLARPMPLSVSKVKVRVRCQTGVFDDQDSLSVAFSGVIGAEVKPSAAILLPNRSFSKGTLQGSSSLSVPLYLDGKEYFQRPLDGVLVTTVYNGKFLEPTSASFEAADTSAFLVGAQNSVAPETGYKVDELIDITDQPCYKPGDTLVLEITLNELSNGVVVVQMESDQPDAFDPRMEPVRIPSGSDGVELPPFTITDRASAGDVNIYAYVSDKDHEGHVTITIGC